jgi:hypothetical protein
VSGVIHEINNISATIAAAVEEQSATTNEMTRNTSEAASGAGDISANIGSVAQAAEGTLSRAQESLKAAQDLASIAAELSKLMEQFKIERRDRRIQISLPVHLSAVDSNGQPLEEEVRTINVSRKGALLQGIRGSLVLGDQVSLTRANKSEQFLLAWVGSEDTPGAGQVGVSAVDPATTFWNDVIETHSQAERAGAQAIYSATSQTRPKARAQGA